MIESKTFKLETPKSESDSNYSEYEYLLGWYGRNGSFYTYLFTDWEQSVSTKTQIMNITDVDKLESLIIAEENELVLVAEDVSRNDMLKILSIYIAKKIIRINKNGTTENVTINNNNKVYRQTNGRYNIEIDISEAQEALPK